MNPTLIAAILSASVPTTLIIVGIFLSRGDYHKLDAKLAAKIDKLDAKLDNKIEGVRSELLKEITAVRSQQHADMLRICELFGEHGERITRIEASLQGR
jgi:hypothetical protein